MSKKFEGISEEKQKKIIDACIEEFAENGYERASTNIIVKRAGISKGILFHYFGNKKNLYLYVLDYVTDYMVERFFIAFRQESNDIFQKLIDWTMVKLKVAYEEPLMSKLIINVFTDIPEDLKQEIGKRYQKLYNETMAKFLQDIDMTKFRKGIDPQKAIEVLVITIEGIGNKYQKLYKDKLYEHYLKEADKIMEELKEYIEIIKGGIY
ncbi:MAG: TetR/AcrR family transcriptional regulator [Clostridia bacterium]|nr:TetR/AcrR family transcriptional regulator [Clostridia bacterium]